MLALPSQTVLQWAKMQYFFKGLSKKINIWKCDLFNVSVVLIFHKDTSESKSEKTKKPAQLLYTFSNKNRANWHTLKTKKVSDRVTWQSSLLQKNTKVCSNCSILSDPLKRDVCRLIRAPRAHSHPLWSGHRSSTNQEPAAQTPENSSF